MTAKIRIDGLELEYCVPSVSDNAWRAYLSDFEQGITTAVFSVADVEAAVAAIPAADRRRGDGGFFSLTPEGCGYRLCCKPILGFHIELLQNA